MQEQVYQLASSLRAAWRYRWFAIATAWIIAIGGWTLVYRMPDHYEATARVWVDTQSVLKNLLSGVTTQLNVPQMIGMLSRTLLSRPNVEKVIEMAGMESASRTPEAREVLITRLTKEVTVMGAGSDNLFGIAYTDQDPKRAELVVRSLLTIFVESSRSDQRKDAEAAQRFLDEEIKTYQDRLDAAENAVIEFKRRRLLASSVRGDHATQLANLEATLRELALELKVAELGRNAIKNNSLDQAEVPDLLNDPRAGTAANPELDARIKDLEQKLDALRLAYTDQHPDVVAMVRTIAQLEDQKKAEVKTRNPSPRTVRIPDSASRQSRLSLATAEANVAAVKARIAEYSKRYEELRSAAIAEPEIDAEYMHLSREYETAKNTYASMLSRREIARISDKMETTAPVTNFRIVDPPRVSSRPKSPNRPRLNAIVLVVALAGGVALAYLLSQLMPTISDERRLREVSGAQVLATVLKDWTDKEKKQRTRDVIAFVMSFVTLLSAYAAVTLAVGLASRA